MNSISLKTITLAFLVVMLVASCGGGVMLQTETIELTQKQKKDALKQIAEARKKAAQEQEANQETRPEDKNKEADPEPRLPRATPQISEDILFKLIYYVGINRKDKRRAVILDLDDDGIDFIPTVRDFEYEILQNVSMEEATYEAEIFFMQEGIIEDYYFKKIIGPMGNIIGYEIRPTYVYGFYRDPDPLEIKYSLNRQRVSVSIDLKGELKGRLIKK